MFIFLKIATFQIARLKAWSNGGFQSGLQVFFTTSKIIINVQLSFQHKQFYLLTTSEKMWFVAIASGARVSVRWWWIIAFHLCIIFILLSAGFCGVPHCRNSAHWLCSRFERPHLWACIMCECWNLQALACIYCCCINDQPQLAKGFLQCQHFSLSIMYQSCGGTENCALD